jgi:aspartate/tyrosine/aromatic aminotransferase
MVPNPNFMEAPKVAKNLEDSQRKQLPLLTKRVGRTSKFNQLSSSGGGVIAMVLKAAAREALSQPPAGGDQVVEVWVPGGRSAGGAWGTAGTP